MKKLIMAIAALVSLHAQAGVVAFSGPAAEKLFIQDAPKLGKDVFLIKFEGIESKWAGKPIKTTRFVKTGGDERYRFDYVEELSSGKKTKTYEMIVEAGKTLVNGTITRRISLYCPECGRDGTKLTYDRELSTASQKIGLPEEHAKSPFTPEVD